MSNLILLRHGQSVWNAKNLFTGWVNIPLSALGIEEALEAGRKIRHIPIDCIFTSTLIRAQMTATLAMTVHGEERTPVFISETFCDKEAMHGCIPVYQDSALNERMYGKLQGMNKAKMAEVYGAEQVHTWRRSYDISPPGGESLKQTAERTLPYFHSHILPELKKGKNVFVCAHGNSLRSIVMELDGLSPEQIVKLEIPTGQPLLYEYSAKDQQVHKLS